MMKMDRQDSVVCVPLRTRYLGSSKGENKPALSSANNSTDSLITQAFATDETQTPGTK